MWRKLHYGDATVSCPIVWDRGVTYLISVPGGVQSVCLCDCLFAEVNIQEQDFTGRTLRWVSLAIVSEVVSLPNSGVKY